MLIAVPNTRANFAPNAEQNAGAGTDAVNDGATGEFSTAKGQSAA